MRSRSELHAAEGIAVNRVDWRRRPRADELVAAVSADGKQLVAEMVRPAENGLGRARRDRVERLTRVRAPAEKVIDAVERDVVALEMPRDVEPGLTVLTERSVSVMLQQEEAVHETYLRRVGLGLGDELSPVADADVYLDVFAVMVVLEALARPIDPDDAVVDKLVGRLEPDPGPRPG